MTTLLLCQCLQDLNECMVRKLFSAPNIFAAFACLGTSRRKIDCISWMLETWTENHSVERVLFATWHVMLGAAVCVTAGDEMTNEREEPEDLGGGENVW
jgi:hypothetical protein